MRISFLVFLLFFSSCTVKFKLHGRCKGTMTLQKPEEEKEEDKEQEEKAIENEQPN